MVVVVFLVQGFEVFGQDVVKLLEEDLAISVHGRRLGNTWKCSLAIS
jgi:hypothetical protein